MEEGFVVTGDNAVETIQELYDNALETNKTLAEIHDSILSLASANRNSEQASPEGINELRAKVEEFTAHVAILDARVARIKARHFAQ